MRTNSDVARYCEPPPSSKSDLELLTRLSMVSVPAWGFTVPRPYTDQVPEEETEVAMWVKNNMCETASHILHFCDPSIGPDWGFMPAVGEGSQKRKADIIWTDGDSIRLIIEVKCPCEYASFFG